MGDNIDFFYFAQLSRCVGVDFCVPDVVLANAWIMHAHRMTFAVCNTHAVGSVKPSVVDFYKA